MSGLAWDETAESVLRDPGPGRERGQYFYIFCSADSEQDWRSCLVDLYPAKCADRTYMHTEKLREMAFGSGID